MRFGEEKQCSTFVVSDSNFELLDDLAFFPVIKILVDSVKVGREM
jgi:hypothetical protein